jgi:hypothetical protein
MEELFQELHFTSTEMKTGNMSISMSKIGDEVQWQATDADTYYITFTKTFWLKEVKPFHRIV